MDKPDGLPLNPLVTQEEAAAILGLNRTKVGLLIEVGEIPSFVDGLGARCVHRADVVEWGTYRHTRKQPANAFVARAFLVVLVDAIHQALVATAPAGDISQHSAAADRRRS